MSSEENKATVRRLFDEGWNKQNSEAIAGFYAPGEYIEGMKQFASRLFAAFPDYRVAIEDLVAEEDKVVVRWRAKGTQKGEWLGLTPTGKMFDIIGIDIERFADGKIIAEDGVYEGLTMLEQLGVELPGTN